MGIGESLAREFSGLGAELLLVARSEEKLKKLCEELSASGGRCDYLLADLSKPEASSTLVQTILSQGKLDGIVHNAGVGLYGTFEQLNVADIRELFEVNFFSVLNLTHGLLPLLKKSSRPTVMLVASIVAWRSIARLNVYSASKAALSSFAEALRVELQPYGIRIVNTYPGRTRTEFSANAKTSGWRPFSSQGQGMSSTRVAKKLARAYCKGKRDEFVSLSNRFLMWGNFLFPRLIDWGLGRYFKSH